jgi:hypothetical protein
MAVRFLQYISGPRQHLPGKYARHLALINHRDAVHQNVLHPFGKLNGATGSATYTFGWTHAL